MHPSRQGQSEQWREDWDWLSADTDPELALAALKSRADHDLHAGVPLSPAKIPRSRHFREYWPLTRHGRFPSLGPSTTSDGVAGERAAAVVAARPGAGPHHFCLQCATATLASKNLRA